MVEISNLFSRTILGHNLSGKIKNHLGWGIERVVPDDRFFDISTLKFYAIFKSWHREHMNTHTFHRFDYLQFFRKSEGESRVAGETREVRECTRTASWHDRVRWPTFSWGELTLFSVNMRVIPHNIYIYSTDLSQKTKDNSPQNFQ